MRACAPANASQARQYRPKNREPSANETRSQRTGDGLLPKAEDERLPDPALPGGERRSDMKLELLHITDCPNTEATRRLLDETLREMGLTEEIREIEVCDSSQAQALS